MTWLYIVCRKWQMYPIFVIGRHCRGGLPTIQNRKRCPISRDKDNKVSTNQYVRQSSLQGGANVRIRWQDTIVQ